MGDNPLDAITGNPMVKNVVGALKKAYFYFEDKYYAFLDQVNKYVPIYRAVDPIDKVVPSFVLLISLVFLLALFFVFLSVPLNPVDLTATIKVEDNKGSLLEGVSIELDLPDETKSLLTDGFGEARVEIPEGGIEASAFFSKKGFQFLEKAVFLSEGETISITMQPVSEIIAPVGSDAEKKVKVVNSVSNELIIEEVTLSFVCTVGGSAPKAQKGKTGEFVVIQPSNCPALVATAEVVGYSKKSLLLSNKVNYIFLTAHIDDPGEVELVTGKLNVIVNNEDGDPEPDVAVMLIDETTNAMVDSKTTTSGGTVLLEKVQPGNYTLSVISPDGRTAQKTGIYINVDETITETITLPNLVEVEPKKIMLRVVEEAVNEPVEGVEATIYEDNVLIFTESSDSNGIIERNLTNEESTYLVVFSHADFVTKTVDNIELKPVSETKPTEIGLVRVVIEPPDPTSGEIMVLVVDEEQDPVGNALVNIYEEEFPTIPINNPGVVTIDDGSFTFTNIGPGRYFVRAEDEHGRAEGLSETVAVVLGQTVNVEIMLVLGEGSVEAKIFDSESESEDPVPNASVEFMNARGDSEVLATCTTNQDGKCESPLIPADKYVYVKASAAGYLPAIYSREIPIVNKAKSRVSIGLLHESSIPDSTENLDVRFRYFCTSQKCDDPANSIESGETGTKTYYAKFELIFSEAGQYTGTVQHVRVGPDSEIFLPLPNDYGVKLMGATGSFFDAAVLSKCWNNDSENPFSDPSDCPVIFDAKQANIYYSNVNGKNILPFVIEFDIEPGLEEGTMLEMHYFAKSDFESQEVFTEKKTKYFQIGEALCDNRFFSWRFDLEGPDGSAVALDLESEAANNLVSNQPHEISYRVYNCSNRDFSSVSLFSEILSNGAETVSFTPEKPFETGPVDAYSSQSFDFLADTEISNDIAIYAVNETEFVEIEFSLGAGRMQESILIPLKVSSENKLAVSNVPQKISPYGNPVLVGTVSDKSSSSAFVENAYAVLKVDGEIMKTASTDQLGIFRMANIGTIESDSRVELVVRKAGYETFRKQIGVGVEIMPVPTEVDCVSIERNGKTDVEILFTKGQSSSASFLVKNGCPMDVSIQIESKLKFGSSEQFGLKPGLSQEVVVLPEIKPNIHSLYIGEYAVFVKAKASSQGQMAPYSGPVQTARVYVDDPNSCFSISDTSFDISSGPVSGWIENKCFEYFEDVSMPSLKVSENFSVVEDSVRLSFNPPESDTPTAHEKFILFDPPHPEGGLTGAWSELFNIVPGGGFVFLDWVDFFLTDGKHYGGSKHKVSVETFEGRWSGITELLPFIGPEKGSSVPVIDNEGFVDIDVFYEGPITETSVFSGGPMWQAQHNVCGRNLGAFGNGLGKCSLDGYLLGNQVVPYAFGHDADRIELEIQANFEDSLATKLHAMKVGYTSFDKDHEGIIDFELQNDGTIGEGFTVLRVEDTVGSEPERQEDLDVVWQYYARGITETEYEKSRIRRYLRTAKLLEGGFLGIPVDRDRRFHYPCAADCDLENFFLKKLRLTRTPKLEPVYSFDIVPSGKQVTGFENASLSYYYYLEGLGWTSSQGEIFVDSSNLSKPITAYLKDPETGAPIENVHAILLKNDGPSTVKITWSSVKSLVVESTQETRFKEGIGSISIPAEGNAAEFDLPEQPWTNVLHPGNYDKIEYILKDSVEGAVVYFAENGLSRITKAPGEPQPSSGIALTSSPLKKRRTSHEFFHVNLVGPQESQCLGENGLNGTTGPAAKPRVMFNWDWENISMEACNTDNPNFIYCDPTQFTIALVKRLQEMASLVKGDFSQNLSGFDNMRKFEAYFIEDAYSDDFREDFVDFFDNQLSSGKLSDPEYPWRYYLLNNSKLSFDTGNSSNVVEAGLHEVYIDVDFTGDQGDFFYIQGNPSGEGSTEEGTLELLANINVRITKLSNPVLNSPFYYLPFNGGVGINTENGRAGYGLKFSNETGPLAVISDISEGTLYDTSWPATGVSARKTVTTAKLEDFDLINTGDRGIVMKVYGNQAQIDFAPSIATPVLLELAPFNGNVDAFYRIVDTTDQVQQETIFSEAGYMAIWKPVGSTIKGAGDACYDFHGASLGESIVDKQPPTGNCASAEPGSFGFSYTGAGDNARLFFETVFYAPRSKIFALKKSCSSAENNSQFYSPVEGTGVAMAASVSLGRDDITTMIESMNDIVKLVEAEYVCVSRDSETDMFSFWWNPQKILEGLEGKKQSLEKYSSCSEELAAGPRPLNCSEKGGQKCSFGETCSAATVTASDTIECCLGRCAPAAECFFGADCDDGDSCTVDSCLDDYTCSNAGVSSCDDGDGCCPSTCDSGNDSDCEGAPETCSGLGGSVCASEETCSEATVTAGDEPECCVGTCSVSGLCSSDGDCDDGDYCTVDNCMGNFTCSYTVVSICADDGCCPAVCNSGNDNDC